jgi:transcriptional regulator with XRE-family HTH domain
MASENEHPLTKRRRELELRLVDVSARCGVSVGLLSQMEHKYVPKKSTRRRVADALSTDLDTLWPEEDNS